MTKPKLKIVDRNHQEEDGVSPVIALCDDIKAMIDKGDLSGSKGIFITTSKDGAIVFGTTSMPIEKVYYLLSICRSMIENASYD